MQIIPSILVQDEETFLTQYKAIEGSVSMIQLDIADGVFVDNTTWADPKIIAKEVACEVELHLMVANPLEELQKWEDVEQVTRVLIHYESVDDIQETLTQLTNSPWSLGVVLNPDTAPDVIDSVVDMIDVVMCMGVHPGKQGQSFIPKTNEKIFTLKSTHPTLLVSVDGAVNMDTIENIAHAGADIVCPGSTIFKSGSPKENIQKMNDVIHSLTDEAEIS
ncbi:hypothetical protein KKG22_04040 [Patescibacteria group bacterium]|nr:hypothetical protein [Patescibacteria group bacterium]MBU1721312.1 hypothetical protein [Patescibacteria group bacterium]MBU1901742.1 hypothetical protein [Patescibacteria group bacterium]